MSGDKPYSYKNSGTNDQVCFFSSSTLLTHLGKSLLCKRPRQLSTKSKFLSLLKHVSLSPGRFDEILIWRSDGSYYYSNPDGSTYHNDGQGGSTYTAPSGNSGNIGRNGIIVYTVPTVILGNSGSGNSKGSGESSGK